MPSPAARIHRASMLTAVGLGVAQTFTSVRAGLAGFEESALQNSRFEPHVLAKLPEFALPPLAETLEGDRGLSGRCRRLLRLAAPALDGLLGELPDDVESFMIPVFLATPETSPGQAPPVPEQLLELLDAQSVERFDAARSGLCPFGRAGGLLAVDQAIRFVESGAGDFAVAGGVDSFFDLRLLAELDRDGRVLAPGVQDGFVPGEASAFLLVGREGAMPHPELAPWARVCGVSLSQEPGHRFSEEPYRGDGLSDAFADLLDAPGVLREPVRTVFAGLNGESFGAKEWGVASLRASARFEPEPHVEHPADCFGDTGAAMAPLMMGLAAYGLRAGLYEPPALVWCSSDGPGRGAAVIDVIQA